jgi:hypothetical protein
MHVGWAAQGANAMKVNVEVECTPEEARRAVGLPDLSPIHERYVSMMLESMSGTVKPELLDSMMKSWAPMGEAGMNFWRRMFDGSMKSGD